MKFLLSYIFLFCFAFQFAVFAKTGTRMRKKRSSAPIVSAAVLTWNPSSSNDDFMTTTPQTFTLTNTGSLAATNLSFTAPIVTDKFSFVSGSNTFIITAETCGTTLAAGASCTVDIEWFTCNDQCLAVVPSVCNGTVQAMADAGVTANLNPLYFNCGAF